MPQPEKHRNTIKLFQDRSGAGGGKKPAAEKDCPMKRGSCKQDGDGFCQNEQEQRVLRYPDSPQVADPADYGVVDQKNFI